MQFLFKFLAPFLARTVALAHNEIFNDFYFIFGPIQIFHSIFILKFLGPSLARNEFLAHNNNPY